MKKLLLDSTSIEDITKFLADKYLSNNKHKYNEPFYPTEKKIIFYNYDYETGALKINKDIGNIPEGYVLSKNDICFLKKRIKDLESNRLVHGFFTHIIFLHSKSDIEIRTTFISDFLFVLKEHQDYPDFTILGISKTLIYYSFLCNTQKDEIKNEIINIIKDINIDSYIKKELIIWIYNGKKISIQKYYKPSILEQTNIPIITEWIDNYDNNNESFLKTILKIRQEEGEEKHIYHLLAENQNKKLDNTDNWGILEELNKKAIYHKYANEYELYNITMNKLTEIKQKRKFPVVQFLYPIENVTTQQVNNIFTIIKQSSPSKRYEYIAHCEEWFKESSQAKDISLKDSLHNLYINYTQFDINNNIISNDTQIQTIDFQIALIETIIKKAIKNKLITIFTIQSFLHKTWIKQRYPINGKSESWLNVLIPGLKELFRQFYFHTTKNKKENYILCIDSLTPKIEGIIRDFIKYKDGITTKFNKQDEPEEILLEGLIEKIYINPFEKEFIKHVLTKSGKNIRNNIAHSFFYSEDYNIETAIDLLVCLLIISSKDIE